MQEASELFRREVALATSELGRSIRNTLAATAAIAIGAIIVFAGVLVLLAAAVLGLSRVLPPWLAALVLGASISVIGAASVGYAARRLQQKSLLPKRSVRSLGKDKDVITRQETS